MIKAKTLQEAFDGKWKSSGEQAVGVFGHHVQGEVQHFYVDIKQIQHRLATYQIRTTISASQNSYRAFVEDPVHYLISLLRHAKQAPGRGYRCIACDSTQVMMGPVYTNCRNCGFDFCTTNSPQGTEQGDGA